MQTFNSNSLKFDPENEEILNHNHNNDNNDSPERTVGYQTMTKEFFFAAKYPC
jgi:hypothetical protein